MSPRIDTAIASGNEISGGSVSKPADFVPRDQAVWGDGLVLYFLIGCIVLILLVNLLDLICMVFAKWV